jgi:malate dehydrogenase (oxaloacetate-decarboxylating)
MVQIDLESPVAKYMRRTLYCLSEDESAVKAADIMKTHGVGSVLVKRGEEIVGMVTERDILNRVVGENLDPAKVKLRNVMTTPLITIDAKAKVRDALELMALHNFRRVPVVENGKIVGLLAQRFVVQEDIEELLAKASKPAEEAAQLHAFYRGKIEVNLKVPVRTFYDFALWYTPGVAEPCRRIFKNKALVYDNTNKWNTVAVISDGTRVLGLGDIGPEAAMPVMEGKGLLYKYLGGVDSFPLCLATKDTEKIIETVKILQPSLGGVNLEDISQPKCFTILDRLRAEAEIPVWHDDQQGTATVVLAAAENALKVVGKKPEDVLVTFVGAGASNIRGATLFSEAGFKPGNIIMVDSKGILNRQRTDLKKDFPQKWELAQTTNQEGRSGGIGEALKSADMVVAASQSKPGLITKDMIHSMATDSIVFAIANPQPEIWPWDAKEAGAKVIATGRSDFPNQVNNSLGFPGIFRGVLDVRAKKITDTMCIAAAGELALVAEEEGINEEYILPTMEVAEVYWREAATVGMMAQQESVAMRKISKNELIEEAKAIILRSREMTKTNTLAGYIRLPTTQEKLKVPLQMHQR